MKTQIIKFIILVALSLPYNSTFAQPGFDDDVEDTPIGGGVGLLIAAGVCYGIKKVRNGEFFRNRDHTIEN
jgi:hypothetical protein